MQSIALLGKSWNQETFSQNLFNPFSQQSKLQYSLLPSWWQGSSFSTLTKNILQLRGYLLGQEHVILKKRDLVSRRHLNLVQEHGQIQLEMPIIVGATQEMIATPSTDLRKSKDHSPLPKKGLSQKQMEMDI